jgi:hypothetical protein
MTFVLAIIMLIFLAGAAAGLAIKLSGFLFCVFVIVGILLLLRMML